MTGRCAEMPRKTGSVCLMPPLRRSLSVALRPASRRWPAWPAWESEPSTVGSHQGRSYLRAGPRRDDHHSRSDQTEHRLPRRHGARELPKAASSYQAAHTGVLPRLWRAGSEHHSVDEVRQLVAAIIADAKENGRIRADLTSTDLTIVMWSIRGVIETTRALAPGAS